MLIGCGQAVSEVLFPTRAASTSSVTPRCTPPTPPWPQPPDGSQPPEEVLSQLLRDAEGEEPVGGSSNLYPSALREEGILEADTFRHSRTGERILEACCQSWHARGWRLCVHTFHPQYNKGINGAYAQ